MKADESKLVALALGRIFRMGARPFQSGDIEEYERCRAIVLDAAEDMTGRTYEPHKRAIEDARPNYARDRFRGAQGD